MYYLVENSKKWNSPNLNNIAAIAGETARRAVSSPALTVNTSSCAKTPSSASLSGNELVASFVNLSNLLKSWDKTDIRQVRRSGACGQKNTAITRMLAQALPRSRTHFSDRTALV